MYLRWLVDPRPALEAKLRTQEIVQRNKDAKINVIKLRKQLADVAKEAEALGLLASVQDILEEEENLEQLLLDQSGLDGEGDDDEEVFDQENGVKEVFNNVVVGNPIQFDRLDMI